MPKRRRATLAEMLLDEIKDSIDALHDIKNKKKRLEAAKDLVEYINLHYIEYPS